MQFGGRPHEYDFALQPAGFSEGSCACGHCHHPRHRTGASHGTPRGPGGVEAGVPVFIDRQLDLPYGHGAYFYMQGPFHPDAHPTLGYQLKSLLCAPLPASKLAISSGLRPGRNAWSVQGGVGDDSGQECDYGRQRETPATDRFEEQRAGRGARGETYDGDTHAS
jgi:hypothetical protein